MATIRTDGYTTDLTKPAGIDINNFFLLPTDKSQAESTNGKHKFKCKRKALLTIMWPCFELGLQVSLEIAKPQLAVEYYTQEEMVRIFFFQRKLVASLWIWHVQKFHGD